MSDKPIFCPNCGFKNEGDARFCVECGENLLDDELTVVLEDAGEPAVILTDAPALDPTPADASVDNPTPKEPANKAPIIAACVVLVAILAVVGTGFFTNWTWFGLVGSSSQETQDEQPAESADGSSDERKAPDASQQTSSDESAKSNESATSEKSESSEQGALGVKDSLDKYSWDEISQISKKIASAKSDDEAISVAASYNLCDKNGSLASKGSKAVELSNGKTVHVRIIGFRHDVKEDGTKAGITFLFDEAVSMQPYANSGLTSGGWKGSSARSWLSDTFYPLLPEDARAAIVGVKKSSNNKGGVSEGSFGAEAVSSTTDKLFLLSLVEIAGNSDANHKWQSPYTDAQYSWCNSVTDAEGSQYSLFSELGVSTHAPNSKLVRSCDGEATMWWMRSANPHYDSIQNTVSATGQADEDSGAITPYGIVPAFCV